MDILSNFGETLHELISDVNLTPEAFAQKVNIDRSVVYKYLRKEVLPTLPNLIAIADFLQCSVDYLIGVSPVNPETKYRQTPPFAIRFQSLLSEKGLTRYAFLKEHHFAKQSVDDWFHGKRCPSVENLINLSKCFGCSVDYLLGRES